MLNASYSASGHALKESGVRTSITARRRTVTVHGPTLQACCCRLRTTRRSAPSRPGIADLGHGALGAEQNIGVGEMFALSALLVITLQGRVSAWASRRMTAPRTMAAGLAVMALALS